MLFDCNSEIPSALAQEEEVHFRRRNFSDMLGSETGDPGPLPGYLGKGTLPRSPRLTCRVTAD